MHDISIAKLGKRVTALTIDSVAGHHRGNYTCRAINRAGTFEQSATLFVNGLFFLKYFFNNIFFHSTPVCVTSSY